jgi:hypothetical protein
MSLLAGPRTPAMVTLEAEKVEVRLVDENPQTVEFFAAHAAADHAVLAEEAWRIGVRALASAFRQAEEARLKDVGLELVADVEKQLKQYLERQEKDMTGVLQRYFSPEDGQLTERLKRLLEDDGDLARVLKQYVAPERSVLAETLAQRIGETSPLFKLLSPTDSEGLVQQMEKRFQQALQTHAETVFAALDPGKEGTPVQRFLFKLKGDLKEAGDDQEKVLKALTAAIDPSDENSLINRLQRDVQKANKDLLTAINPDIDGSPMATIKKTLTSLLEKQMEENRDFREKADERQQKFETEVKEALARIEQRKKETDRSTHGGFDFEADVLDFVATTVAGGPYMVEETGSTVGHLARSKVGDQVIRFAAEHAFAGCGLVVEAKRAANYNVAKALDELEEAKKNRGCDVGLFVMAESHRARGFPRFARYGTSVLVAWDPEDPATNAYLHAAVLTGLSLATRTRARDQGDIAALHDIENRIQSEVQRLDKMSGLVGNIQRDAGKLEDEIRRAKGKLDVLVRNAKDVLAALKVELQAEDEERASPILVDEDSFTRTGALPDAVRAAAEAPIMVAARTLQRDHAHEAPKRDGPRQASYWLEHLEEWPTDSVYLGAESYDPETLMRLLAGSLKEDVSLELARELLAAELNSESGNTLSEEAEEAMYEAHDILGNFDGRLPYGVTETHENAPRMEACSRILHGFNAGQP